MILRLLFLILFIPNCVFSQQQFNNYGSDLFEKVKLPPSINTEEFDEYAPSISGDGKTIIFIRSQTGVNKLYESKILSDGSWSESVLLEQVNEFFSSGFIQSLSISYDGCNLYISGILDGNKGNEDIFISTRNNGKWSTPINIGSPVNTAGFEGFPSSTTDNRSMYFARIRQDNPLDKDKNFEDACYELYVSKIDNDGNWKEPVKLPYPVNDLCEKAARILSDNLTLVFLSHRTGQERSGYIHYFSRFEKEGDWSNPVPLGFINDLAEDFLLSVPASGEVAYFSSQGDLYFINIPSDIKPIKTAVLSGRILDSDSDNIIQSDIIVRNVETNKILINQTNNPQNGTYYLTLPVGKVYSTEFKKKGFSTVMNIHDLRFLNEFSIIEKDVPLFSTVFCSLRIMDIETYEILPVNVQVFEEGQTRELSLPINVSDNGLPVLSLPVNASYQIQVHAKNFKDTSITIDLSNPVFFRNIECAIYMMPEKVEVPIHLINKNTNQQVQENIKITNRSREELMEIYANEKVRLRLGDQYEIEIETDQRYFSGPVRIEITKEGLKIINDNKSVTVNNKTVEIQLTPVEIGGSILLDNIHFENNSAIISESTYEKLDRLVDIMKKYPTMIIDVSLKSNKVFSEEYAAELMAKKSRSIRDYLIIHGVEPNRIESKNKTGLMMHYPGIDGKKGETRYRVDIKVVEVF